MTTIKYRGGYKYQLAEDVDIRAPELGVFLATGTESRFLKLVHDEKTETTYLDFKAGYAWDGPSGPMMDTKTAMVASLAHDGGAQIMRRSKRMPSLIRTQFIRKNNDLFYRLCIEGGMWKFRAKYARWGVSRVTGYADPANKKPILEAP